MAASRLLAPVAVGAAGVALWFVLVDVVGVAEFLLPRPGDVATELGERADVIASSAAVTGANALWGLVGGALLGVALAAVAARWWLVDGMVGPLVTTLAVVPIVALAPLLNTMLGTDQETGRRVVAGIAAFVPVFVNTLRGLRQTTPLQRDLMRSYAATGGQVFRTVTLPVAVPYAFTGLRLASSLAVISALVAEYFGGPRDGLGSSISSAASSNHARAWAYVLGAIALGLLFFAVTSALERLAQRRVPISPALSGGSR